MYLSHLRTAGYTATLLLHVGHLLVLGLTVNFDQHVDPEVNTFAMMRRRFFTCWNFYVQMMYASTGLYCERLLRKNAHVKDYQLPRRLRGFRDTLFSAIMWPATCVVFSVFWSLFLYDRELIFPPFVDQVLSPTSNHIIHTAIVPVALWELMFRPRPVPKSHKRNLLHLTAYMAVYCFVLLYTYYERDLWLYPIFKKLYGTVYFPISILFIFLLSIIYYYMQWIVTFILYRNYFKKPTNVKRKVK